MSRPVHPQPPRDDRRARHDRRAQAKTSEYRQAQPAVGVFTHTIARYELRTMNYARRIARRATPNPIVEVPHECQHRATQE